VKKIIVLSLTLVLTACGGGYDANSVGDKTPHNPHDGNNSGIINGKPNIPKPSVPDVQVNWKYSSSEINETVLSLSATNYSLNTFKRPGYNNLDGNLLLKLERVRSQDGSINDTVAFFVDSKISCSPFCEVRMSFDGEWVTFHMQNSIDGVIKPISDSTETVLFKKLSSSKKATISLPIIGLPAPFNADFNLSDYDTNRMILE
jgi:hypothetical protein